MSFQNTIQTYIDFISELLEKFIDDSSGLYLSALNQANLKQNILEVYEILNAELGKNNLYSNNLMNTYNTQVGGFPLSPTYKGVLEIRGILTAAKKVNIEASELKKSPIIVDSPETKIISKEPSNHKTKEDIFTFSFLKKNIAKVVVGIIVLVIGGYILHLITKDIKVTEPNKPKVHIQDSNLDKSPVILDSPGAIVGDKNVINKLDTPEPKVVYKEIYNVKSKNQKGGLTAGKIETLNIFTDKVSLGMREPLGLYKDNKRVGTVVNPNINEDEMIFAFDEIQLDKPIRNGDISFIFSTFEFDKYIIKVTHTETIVLLMPPGATGVKGKILEIK